MEIENLIEKKFRDIKLETKILAWGLRKDFLSLSSLQKEFFTIEPYQIIFDTFLPYKTTFTKDLLYKILKKKVDPEHLDIYKNYILKIYKEKILGLNKKNVEIISSKLKELNESRMLILTMNDIIGEMENFDIKKVKNKLRKVLLKTDNDNKKLKGEYLEDFEERRDLIIHRQKNPKESFIIPIGIKTFDEKSGGLMRGELMIIGAGTGVGKTMFLGNVGLNVWKLGLNVVLFTLEMTKNQVGYRLDSRVTSIFHTKFRKAELEKAELKKWQQKIFALRENKKNFFEIVGMNKGCNTLQIEEELLRIQSIRKKKVDLIIIDYLNLMSANTSYGDRREWKSQAEVAWDLKTLALSFNNGEGVPICSANQLTDEGIGAASKGKLNTTHLKYSRAITEVAQIVLILAQSIDDQLRDIMKLWMVKVRDFGKLNQPIILYPNFPIMSFYRNIDSLDNFKNKFITK